MNVSPTEAVPADGVIQIAFDRVLLTASVTRQAFLLGDANNVAINPVVTYDPVRRIVTLSNPAPAGGSWLTPGLSYKLILTTPGTSQDHLSGARAIDGAVLDSASAVETGFMAAAPANAGPIDAKMSFCNDVLPIFQARCSAGQCHGAPTIQPPSERFPDGHTVPAAGLLLETSQGVLATAIGRVAQGSNTGATAGAGGPPYPKFGIDLPLIDPGDPANSWLMYKVLLAPLPTADAGVLTNPNCGDNPPPPTAEPAPATQFMDLSDDERARLENYVLGSQMPYPPSPGRDDRSQNLTEDELERVRAWIAEGATVNDCSSCSQ
ncbi:MAG: hypothetical protein ACRELY_00140 [Polyangiaceae bacterium]